MKKMTFWTLFAFMNLIFIFITIYQHNIYTNLTYRKQRLENTKNSLKLHKNETLITLLDLKQRLLETYLTDTTMSSLTLSNVRTMIRENNG